MRQLVEERLGALGEGLRQIVGLHVEGYCVGEVAVRWGRYLGDYIAAATAPDGTLDTMWTDTPLGRPKETDLWFARVPPGYPQAGTSRVVGW